jgi:hypothetical protein
MCPHDTTSYARAETLVAHDTTGTITAVSPTPQLAYQHHTTTRHLSIRGARDEHVALASARIARDALRGMLLADGWTLLHASAAVRDGQTVLTFGSKGAGKTTTALALATRGWQLLSNDRLFVRPGVMLLAAFTATHEGYDAANRCEHARTSRSLGTCGHTPAAPIQSLQGDNRHVLCSTRTLCRP